MAWSKAPEGASRPVGYAPMLRERKRTAWPAIRRRAVKAGGTVQDGGRRYVLGRPLRPGHRSVRASRRTIRGFVQGHPLTAERRPQAAKPGPPAGGGNERSIGWPPLGGFAVLVNPRIAKPASGQQNTFFVEAPCRQCRREVAPDPRSSCCRGLLLRRSAVLIAGAFFSDSSRCQGLLLRFRILIEQLGPGWCPRSTGGGSSKLVMRLMFRGLRPAAPRAPRLNISRSSSSP